MNHPGTAGHMAPSAQPDRSRSEKIFVFVGLTIVLGGLWMLYMGDAPYHPEVGVEGQIQLIEG